MIPVIHKSCGGQIGWSKQTPISLYEGLRAECYTRLDGTQPELSEVINEICPHCHRTLQHKKDFTFTKGKPLKTDSSSPYVILIITCCLLYLTTRFFLDCIP